MQHTRQLKIYGQSIFDSTRLAVGDFSIIETFPKNQRRQNCTRSIFEPFFQSVSSFVRRKNINLQNNFSFSKSGNAFQSVN